MSLIYMLIFRIQRWSYIAQNRPTTEHHLQLLAFQPTVSSYMPLVFEQRSHQEISDVSM